MARRIVLSSDSDEPSRSPEDLTIDYADDLNEQQYAAATAGDGPLLIVAGAGTGKTRTLIYRTPSAWKRSGSTPKRSTSPATSRCSTQPMPPTCSA